MWRATRKKRVAGKNVLGILSAVFVLTVAGYTADQTGLHWIVKSGQDVNKPQAERLYVEACRWIENRFGSEGKAIRPTLAVHVGKPCPNPEISGACLNPVLRELYIPKWDEASAGAVTQATLVTALLQLMDRHELQRVARVLLEDDGKNFLDARQFASRAGK